MILLPTSTKQTNSNAPYCGITIYTNPSRLDKDTLLSGMAGQWFEEDCIYPHKLFNCDVRNISNEQPLRANTKAIFTLGEPAARKFNLSLERPGYSTLYQNIPVIPVFHPQDCVDHTQIEAATYDENSDETYTERQSKDSYPTSRANWRFWTTWHCKKINTQVPTYPSIAPLIYPQLTTICKWLDSQVNTDIYLDIETSRAHRGISCIGLSSPSLFPAVYVVPIYTYNNAIAYSNITLLYRALFQAFQRNRIVAHNASFDLLVLRAFYKLPLPSQVYCTMIANHRCFPEAEKSLAHLIAQWTNEPYHKDTATDVFDSDAQNKMWHYNAKDVYVLHLIKRAQDTYASLDQGLQASIIQGNDSIVPYITTSLTGLRLNHLALAKTENILRARARQFERVCSVLVGKPFKPNSPKQCQEFFHKTLNYPVVKRSETGNPKLGSKEFYTLLSKHKNPLIKAILAYREVAKDASMLESVLYNTP